MNELLRYFPYVSIGFVKTYHDLLDVILCSCWLYIIFSHTDDVLRREISKHGQQNTFKLLRQLLYIWIVIFVISYLKYNSIFIVRLVTGNIPSTPLNFGQLLFSVGVTDWILMLITVTAKIGITLLPRSWIEYNKRVSYWYNPYQPQSY